jgi:hypothetical protein
MDFRDETAGKKAREILSGFRASLTLSGAISAETGEFLDL